MTMRYWSQCKWKTVWDVDELHIPSHQRTGPRWHRTTINLRNIERLIKNEAGMHLSRLTTPLVNLRQPAHFCHHTGLNWFKKCELKYFITTIVTSITMVYQQEQSRCNNVLAASYRETNADTSFVIMPLFIYIIQYCLGTTIPFSWTSKVILKYCLQHNARLFEILFS